MAHIASANMLSPAAMDTSILGFQSTSAPSGSMYLGKWRTHISEKLMPRYFSLLSNNPSRFSVSGFSQYNYSTKITRLTTPIFTGSLFSSNNKDSILNFNFSSRIEKISINNIKPQVHNFSSFLRNQHKQDYTSPALIKQEFYSPGYSLSNGNNTFSINAVLIQQLFLSQNSTSIASVLTSSSYKDEFAINNSPHSINRGSGYKVNFNRNLPLNSYINIDYSNSIDMHEIGSLGKNLSDSGNFDIPSQYSMAFGFHLFQSNAIEFVAQKVSYNNVNIKNHKGYSTYFKPITDNLFATPNNLFLKDLMVYSMHFQQEINETFSWNIDVFSKQQPQTTLFLLNDLLENDTAKYNYRIGVSKTTRFGDFNLLASFAKHPILISSTGFGEFSSNSNLYFDGVASWSVQF